MITSGIYNYVNILDKAADAANLRNHRRFLLAYHSDCPARPSGKIWILSRFCRENLQGKRI